MKVKHYATGRNYGAEQVLVITYNPIPHDADMLNLYQVQFTDDSRGISGTVDIFGMDLDDMHIGKAVLEQYDAGAYR